MYYALKAEDVIVYDTAACNPQNFQGGYHAWWLPRLLVSA